MKEQNFKEALVTLLKQRQRPFCYFMIGILLLILGAFQVFKIIVEVCPPSFENNLYFMEHAMSFLGGGAFLGVAIYSWYMQKHIRDILQEGGSCHEVQEDIEREREEMFKALKDGSRFLSWVIAGSVGVIIGFVFAKYLYS